MINYVRLNKIRRKIDELLNFCEKESISLLSTPHELVHRAWEETEYFFLKTLPREWNTVPWDDTSRELLWEKKYMEEKKKVLHITPKGKAFMKMVKMKHKINPMIPRFFKQLPEASKIWNKLGKATIKSVEDKALAYLHLHLKFVEYPYITLEIYEEQIHIQWDFHKSIPIQSSSLGLVKNAPSNIKEQVALIKLEKEVISGKLK